jgi:hypothetical protein
MLWTPTDSELAAKTALPVLSIVAAPRAEVPSVKVTAPVGIAEAPPEATTLAVRATGWPKALGLGFAVKVVTLAALLTTCETTLDAEFEKLLSPE